eukprot:3226208-Amphidinium_carterae.1
MGQKKLCFRQGCKSQSEVPNIEAAVDRLSLVPSTGVGNSTSSMALFSLDRGGHCHISRTGFLAHEYYFQMRVQKLVMKRGRDGDNVALVEEDNGQGQGRPVRYAEDIDGE